MTMSDERSKKKSLSKPRKLVPNVAGRHRRGVRKETHRPSTSQKTSAVFEELVEAAQKESKWERGIGHVRQAPHKATSSVSFGAGLTVGKVEHKGQVWGGENRVKIEERTEKVEDGLDFESLYPTTLPLRPPGEASMDCQDDPKKLLPQYVENKLAEVDSEEEDFSAGQELDFGSIPSTAPMLFQLPSVLPAGMVKCEENGAGKSGRWSHLEEGRIGKLLVYKSGKIRLQLGEALLDVNGGTPNQFHQQLVAINIGEDNGHCVFLGSIQKRAICTFNMFQLLSTEPSSSTSRVEDCKEVQTGVEDLKLDRREDLDSCMVIDPPTIKREDTISFTDS